MDDKWIEKRGKSSYPTNVSQKYVKAPGIWILNIAQSQNHKTFRFPTLIPSRSLVQPLSPFTLVGLARGLIVNRESPCQHYGSLESCHKPRRTKSWSSSDAGSLTGGQGA